MAIKGKYKVEPIPAEQTHDWLLNKHYAKRLPPNFMFSFGLYNEVKQLVGVCVFGVGNRMMNDGFSVFGGNYKVKTYELMRLVVNDGLEKNVLSLFVSKCLMQLPKPLCIYSYADTNVGHHGYIYQATNWIYTGETKPRTTFFDTRTGKPVHEKTMYNVYGTSAQGSIPSYIEVGQEEGGKHRYLYFLGNEQEVKDMRACLTYRKLPYPKGENKRYDASYKPTTMNTLF